MPSLYFTPASVGYLNQFLLSLLIAIYIGVRLFSRERDMTQKQDVLLLFFFAFVTIFSFLLFLEASFLPYERFIVVCLENTILGILLAALIQFAYHFPAVVEKQETERRIAFVITVLYALTTIPKRSTHSRSLSLPTAIFDSPTTACPLSPSTRTTVPKPPPGRLDTNPPRLHKPARIFPTCPCRAAPTACFRMNTTRSDSTCIISCFQSSWQCWRAACCFLPGCLSF